LLPDYGNHTKYADEIEIVNLNLWRRLGNREDKICYVPIYIV